jgi:predicted transcriptional regulator
VNDLRKFIESRICYVGSDFSVARDVFKLSQSEVSRLFHCPVGTISRWERSDVIKAGSLYQLVVRAFIEVSKQRNARKIGDKLRADSQVNPGKGLVFLLETYFKAVSYN